MLIIYQKYQKIYDYQSYCCTGLWYEVLKEFGLVSQSVMLQKSTPLLQNKEPNN